MPIQDYLIWGGRTLSDVMTFPTSGGTCLVCPAVLLLQTTRDDGHGPRDLQRTNRVLGEPLRQASGALGQCTAVSEGNSGKELLLDFFSPNKAI